MWIFIVPEVLSGIGILECEFVLFLKSFFGFELLNLDL
jgi:hypothetical protein